MAAVNRSRIAPGGGYVAALCPPATVSIQQVKIPVGCGGVYTQREVPESDGNWMHGAAAAAAIWKEKRHIQRRKGRGKRNQCLYCAKKNTHACNTMHTCKCWSVTAA